VNALVLLAALTVPAGYQSAPVYTFVSEGILKRTGTFLYQPATDGYTVMFCIAQTPVKLRCAVSTPADLMVIISAEATEHSS
jgi:hypothetical protein